MILRVYFVCLLTFSCTEWTGSGAESVAAADSRSTPSESLTATSPYTQTLPYTVGTTMQYNEWTGSGAESVTTADSRSTSSESLTVTSPYTSQTVPYTGTTMQYNGEKCAFEEYNGFMKYMCHLDGTLRQRTKCPHSDTLYRITYNNYKDGRTKFSALCKNDPLFYQFCGSIKYPMTNNGTTLCGQYLCEIAGNDYKYGYVASSNYMQLVARIICDNNFDCTNTQLDESDCSEEDVVTLPSGISVDASKICNDICEMENYCEDEAECNGYRYGVYCKTNKYVPPNRICDGRDACPNGADEVDCTVTNTTQYTCRHYSTGKIVPILNYVRCWPHKRYCEAKDYSDQTNCSDISRVGAYCNINEHNSTASKYVICKDIDNREPLCDDELDTQCLTTSKACPAIHKHRLCDGLIDCVDDSDENLLICKSTTEATCVRRAGGFGNFRSLAIPISWLHDDMEDCMNGEDEENGWPTCGTGKTRRFVANNDTCHNVLMCKSGDPGYIEYTDLCDGIESCGNENSMCEKSRGASQISTEVITLNKGLEKYLSYCIKGLHSLEELLHSCHSEMFMLADSEVFGRTESLMVLLPNVTNNCESMFGEQYVYSSCTNKCINSPCPIALHNIPRYESCPNQFPKRIGTLANNKFLTFLTRSYEDIFLNNYFVCNNTRTCVDYAKVCDLVDDCGDGSDEEMCTNHFKCKTTGHYIPKTRECDGAFDCLDLSDECNNRCSSQILDGDFLKASSWIIGLLAVIANSIIIGINVSSFRNCRTIVTLLNKSFIVLISLGDLLVGSYLLSVSVYDGLVYGNNYCSKQMTWLTSSECSILGVISTIGSQVSLFAMTGLSMVRVHGIWNSMRIPGKVTLMKSLIAAVGIIFLLAGSTAIAVVPILHGFEDFFVNGLRYDEQLKLFVGLTDKEKHLDVFQEYYGRMNNATLSWKVINKMFYNMFSHDFDYEDFTMKASKVDFFGNDGVCLFKFFVKDDDPQRIFVWSILALNFACFLFISISYIVIGTLSLRSSGNLAMSKENKHIRQRNRRMNQKIMIIITTDFLCWVPFIVICTLHSVAVVDATPWYSLFSMIILPINSVINPLIYDDFIMKHVGTIRRRASIFVSNSSYRQRTREFLYSYRSITATDNPQENLEMGEIGTHQ